ncbi:hypothetical protein D4Z78_00455, partial [Okeania hirsuta]
MPFWGRRGEGWVVSCLLSSPPGRGRGEGWVVSNLKALTYKDKCLFGVEKSANFSALHAQKVSILGRSLAEKSQIDNSYSYLLAPDPFLPSWEGEGR